MPRDIAERRSVRRQKVPWKNGAEVEVTVPGGKRRRFRLIDFSVGNLCFAVPAGVTGIEAGCTLPDSLVVVGKLTVECHLSVVRTWRQMDGSSHCGAKLFPKSEADQNDLVGLVAALESFQATTANTTD